MSKKIGITNYGFSGNTHSVKKALEKAGANVFIINKPLDFKQADKVVISGVGNFKDAMKVLNSNGFYEELINYKKPILGICLGMQVLSTLGFEYGKTKGLCLIEAEVKEMICEAKVPHMGFNKIDVTHPNILLEGVENEEFYFMHSYEVVNYTNITSLTEYGGHSFVSSIKKNNIYGTQFHPEKSREAGIKLLSNFINL